MSDVRVKIVKTEEVQENGIKYLNINVSNTEVERKPDIVRLCADVEFLEYVRNDCIALNEFAERNKL